MREPEQYQQADRAKREYDNQIFSVPELADADEDKNKYREHQRVNVYDSES